VPAVFVVVSSIVALLSQAPLSCPDVASCRSAALEAAERGEFELFHDLAWRAVQKGRQNDPGLMLLLARAQSASGRPGDALVMLRRLSDIGGVHVDVTLEDFRRVRALPGWPEVEATVAAANEKHAARADKAASPTPAPPEGQSRSMTLLPARRAASATASAGSRTTTPAPRTPASPAPPAAAPPSALATPAPAAVTVGEEAVRIEAASIDPVGMAYDSVSRRFVVGDRRQNKLIVADEIFKRVNDLIGAGAGGFGRLTALEIDRRRGDLWVTSDTGGRAALHKLQLVSGRVLMRLDVPEEWHPTAVEDISIGDNGTLLLLDTAGARLLSVETGSGRFTRAIALDVPSPRGIAANGSSVYVAHDQGLAAADLRTRAVAPVRAAKGVELGGLQRVRWHAGGLIALQDDGTGQARLVRIRIGRSGSSATAIEPLDNAAVSAGSPLTIAGDIAYYVATSSEGTTIRRVRLK
jgi:hypothetical protein